LRNWRCIVARIGAGAFRITMDDDTMEVDADVNANASPNAGSQAGSFIGVNSLRIAANQWLMTTHPATVDAARGAEFKFLGTITNIAAGNFFADTQGATTTVLSAYPMATATTLIRLETNVLTNTYAAAGAGGVTTISLFKNGVIVLGTSIVYNPAEVGVKGIDFVVPFAQGDTFDVGVTNPGDGNVAASAEISATLAGDAVLGMTGIPADPSAGTILRFTMKRVDTV